MSVSHRPPSDAPAQVRVSREAPEDAAPHQPAAAPAVEAHRIGKQYNGTWVVRDLDLSVEEGTIFGLFGPSGSGKTTTIRLLLGLEAPDEGEARVLGRPPRRFTASTRAQIGYMPQLFVFYPELTVDQNLGLAASVYGLGWRERRRPMREVLEFVELWEHRHKRAENLSGGMKRRLELAVALVHSPPFVVMDEPTAGVDPILRARFWEHFHELRDRGRTLFITSQYVTEADYCDQVGILGGGGLIANGTPENVRRQAMGGELVDVLAEGLDRAVLDRLMQIPGALSSRRLSYEQVRLTVDDAGAAIPRVLACLAESGIQPQEVEPYRPNFDEVFVRLVEQNGVRDGG